MTFSDARVIGASALTAAAVALATVVVYDGHVKATSGGQTVMVMPGSTVELHRAAPPGPPAPPAPTPPAPPLVAGGPVHAVDRTVAPNPPVGSDGDRPVIHVASATRVYAKRDPKSEVQFVANAGDALYPDEVKGAWTFVEDDEGDGGWVQTSELGKPAPAAPPACDAAALQQQGIAAYSRGDNAGALASFEASLRCKDDQHVNQLAFIAACGGHNANAAGIHYARMPPEIRQAVVMSCVARGITRDQLDRAAAVQDGDAKAHLAIDCTPRARVWIDGNDTKRSTPIADYTLDPGHHKVTFVIGGDRYTYPIEVKAGDHLKLNKDLE